jgi:hypothetical protein
MSNFYDVLDKSKVNNEIQSKGKNSFDKAAWIEKKKSEKEFAYRTIDEMTNKISHDGEMLRKYLYHQSEQNLYSVNNVMLIMAQKPIVTILKDYDGWKECGGSIKQNEEGIIILEPGAEYTREDGSTAVSFNTKKIFDVSQTVGAKLPRTRNVFRGDDRAIMKALVEYSPVPIKVVQKLSVTTMGAFYDQQKDEIYVRAGLSADEFFASIAQEVAHAQLAKDTTYNRTDKVFEAYAVFYMLTNKYGFDVGGFDFKDLPKKFKDAEPSKVKAILTEAKDVMSEINDNMQHSLYKAKEQKDKTYER